MKQGLAELGKALIEFCSEVAGVLY